MPRCHAELWSLPCLMHLRADTRPFRNQRFCTQHSRAWLSCKLTPLGEFFEVEGSIKLLHYSQLWGG